MCWSILINPEELKEILAKKKRVNAVIKDLVDTVAKNDLEKVKSIFEENSCIIQDVVTEVNSHRGKNLLKYSANNKVAEYLIEKGISFSAAAQRQFKAEI